MENNEHYELEVTRTTDNMSLEKLIIQTSILFVSISSVIGLTLGNLLQDYRSAYINLGKMLYYSFPFILASFFAFLAIVAEDQSAKTKVWVKKLAWAFYITGFMFIMSLAVLASRTELLPQGWIFTTDPTYIIFFQLISASIIFAGFLLARETRILTTVFAIVLVVGLFFMTSGVFQTSSVLQTDMVSLQQRFSNSTVSVQLTQAQQVLVTLQSTDNQATFSYSFMKEEEYMKENATGNVFLAKSLAENSFKTQDTFLITIQTTGEYVLFIRNDWFLGNNVTYSIKVYETNSTYSFSGFWMVVSGAAGLCSYVSAKGERGEPSLEQGKTPENHQEKEPNQQEKRDHGKGSNSMNDEKPRKKRADKTTDLLKVQIFADRVHTKLTSMLSFIFAYSISFSVLFYTIFYQGIGPNPGMTWLLGFVGTWIATLAFTGYIIRDNQKYMKAISRMIEAIKEGKPLPELENLSKQTAE